jgi:hypothetical protein
MGVTIKLFLNEKQMPVKVLGLFYDEYTGTKAYKGVFYEI